MRVGRKSVLAVIIALSALAGGQAAASVVWRGDFETGDLSQWSSRQAVSADRLQVVDSPVAQGRRALRVLVRQGDDPINASGNRNELVYLSYEPAGTERWYRWQTMWPADYPSHPSWQLFTQFHHSGNTGSPPLEFVVRGENVGLGLHGEAVWYTALERGVWHDFIFHVKWSPSASEGFIELYYDGELVLPRRAAATQFSGQSQYLKQGLYRDEAIAPQAVVYHDGMVIGTTLDDVLDAIPPEPEPDAGTPEPDAGTVEPEPQPDAGTVDPEPQPDAGTVEPEPQPDAGTVQPDAGTVEPPPDTGEEPADAGLQEPGDEQDASDPVDSGGPLNPPEDEPVPYGCSSAGGPPAFATLMLVLALAFVRRSVRRARL